MIIILYRWRIRAEMEEQFVAGWSKLTANYRENFDSLGSRLHRGDDRIWYAYAQWKSAEQRAQAFAADLSEFADDARQMREAILENYPEIVLNPVSDYLVLPKIETS